MTIVNNLNDTLTEKRYLDYGDFKIARILGMRLGLKEPELMDFEKTFGNIRIEIDITRIKDQNTTFKVLRVRFGNQYFDLVRKQ